MKARTGQFKRGLDYPNEGFIQNAIEKYFNSLGYEQFFKLADTWGNAYGKYE